QLVGSTMNNSVSRKAPARFNSPRAGLPQTSAWLTRQAPLREHSPVNSNALRPQVAPGPLYSLRGQCPSFDHLLGAGDQHRRHSQAERPGRFEVDEQVKLGSAVGPATRRAWPP